MELLAEGLGDLGRKVGIFGNESQDGSRTGLGAVSVACRSLGEYFEVMPRVRSQGSVEGQMKQEKRRNSRTAIPRSRLKSSLKVFYSFASIARWEQCRELPQNQAETK